MRLLYVIDSLAPGGAEMSLAEMTPVLVRSGIELHVLPLSRRLDLSKRLEQAGAEIHPGPDGVSRLSSVRRIRRVIAGLRPDLVHTTLYEANVAGRVAARLQGVPSSTSLVGDTYGRRPGTLVRRCKLAGARTVDQATAHFASRFHAVSRQLAVRACSQLRLPATRIDVIPRGRDRERFPFRPAGVRDVVRRELGIGGEIPTILAVGRLERVKGLIHLMEALPALALSVPDAQVLVAGKDGAASQEVRASAARSGIPVRFLGHRTDVGRLLASSDVLAFPSLSEGSPGTLIEAMATGCPIVASDIFPNAEVLGEGVNSVGNTFPVGNSQALAAMLASVLNGSVDVDAVTARARQRFDANYEITAVAARMVRFFETAAGANHEGKAI